MTESTDAVTLQGITATGNRTENSRRLGALAVATLLLALFPAPKSSPLAAQQAEPAAPTVTGKLVGPDGSAAAGLEVRLIPSPSSYLRRLRELGETDAIPIVDRTRSDAEGHFELAASRPGPYRVEILAAAPDTTPPTAVAPVYTRLLPLAEPTALPPIQLPEMHHVVVAAMDEAGEPVEGALVVAQATRWSAPRPRRVEPAVLRPEQPWQLPSGPRQPEPIRPRFDRAVARTSASGLARLFIPTADANVFVSAVGFELRAATIEDGQGRFELRRGAGITLRILDSRGAPVPRAVIRVAESLAVPLALTDERGQATVGLSRGEAIPFQVETEDRAFGRTEPIEVPPPNSAGPSVVDVRVRPAIELSGRVVDAETSQGMEGAPVWLNGRPGDHAWSGPGGAFDLLTRPNVDNLYLSASAAGYRMQEVPVPIERLRSPQVLSVALTPTARITGIVTDSSGNPVADAWILVDRVDPTQAGASLGRAGTSYAWRSAYGMDHQATSRSDGTFRITGVDRRLSHLFTVEAQGFVRSSTELPGIGPSGAADPLQIVLSRGRRTWGKVVDTDERPVPTASITMIPAMQNPGGGISLSFDSYLTATTDAEGAFEFPAVATGSYQLTVDHVEFAGRAPASLDIPTGEGDIDIGSITLTPGMQIEGLVVGPDRRPVAGAQVSAFQDYSTRSPTDAGARAAITDYDGRFRIGGLQDRPVDVTVKADGYASSHLKGVKPATNDVLEIELNRGAVLAGRVVDTGGAVVSSAMVTLFDPEPRPFAGFNAPDQEPVSTDANGRFRFEFLRPGTWRASAFALTGGGRTESGPIHLRTGEVREIELVLASHDAQVVGVVTNHLGNPVERAEVTIIAGGAPGGPSRQAGSSWGTSTGSGGRFQSGPVPAGNATIVGSHPEYRETVREITIDPGSNEVSLVLEPGLEISGSVRSADGRPIPLAAVMAEFDLSPEAMQQLMNDPSTRGRRGSPFQPIEALTDRNGDYRLTGLNAGSYRLKAWADGYGSGDAVGQRVRLEGGSAARVDIVLPAQAMIEVRISGPPLPGVTVRAHQGDFDFRTATQDPGGNYRIERLGPGAWTVTAHAIDGRLAQQTVNLRPGDDTVVELRFEEGLHLTGWVTIAGQPPGGGGIVLLREDTQPRFADLDREGRFELRDALPGAYTLLIEIPGAGTNAGARYERRVEILGDRVLRLDLEASAVLTGLVLDSEGQPLAGAFVGTVQAGAGGQIPRSAVLYRDSSAGMATTDIDGRFELRSPPGSYDLLVASEGLAEHIVQVELAPGEYRQGLVLELRPATNQPP